MALVRLPAPLHLQRVSVRSVAVTMALSGGLVAASMYFDYPLWVTALSFLIPWVPVFLFEEIWRYEHYGAYALFLAVVVLQIGHMGEHTAQVIQLVLHDGDITTSRGVFGQLDFETVHLVWDTAVWLSYAYLLYRFWNNKWLWVSFIFASLHEVEHVYLYWIFKTDFVFYEHGGLAGLLGRGGLIPTPLFRPYLHFGYNLFVVAPLLVAFWDQTKHAFDRYVKNALPDLTDHELVAATEQLTRTRVQPGEVILRQGDVTDRFYIVAEGEVEKVVGDAEKPGQRVMLGPGQFFGEVGLVTGHPSSVTVRATKPTELLVLGRSSFMNIVMRSAGGHEDVESALAQSRTHVEKAVQRAGMASARPTGGAPTDG